MCAKPTYEELQRRVQELELAEAEARAHQERFRIFFSSVNDAIFVHPLQQEGFSAFIEVNDVACRRYGYTRDELLQLSARDITLKTDADAHAAAAHRKQLLAKQRLVFESVHITKSGETFPVEISSNIVQQYGRPVILAVVRDISERKKADEERAEIEAKYRQSQKMEAIGRLAGGVAHDFNNLLTGISGFTEMVLSQLSPDNQAHADALEIQQATERAAALTTQLLAFSRKQVIQPRVIQLNEVVELARRMLARIIGEDVELRFVPGSELWAIRADPTQIDQILVNLATNSRDAMPDGGELVLETQNIQVDSDLAKEISDAKEGPYIMLAVSDDGAGIEHAKLSRIFDPFFTTKGLKEGTGLGLSTVYGIVRQAGGFITVHSKVDIGTTFKVYLPSVDDPEEPLEATQSELRGGSETVLLVEDEDMVRNLVRRMLERGGYSVLEAQHAQEALELSKRQDVHIDLLLTDVIMPKMNGREMYERLVLQRPGLDVVYMSGYTDQIVSRYGKLDPQTRLVQKPFTSETLLRTLRTVLDSARKR